jgi:hypothetical protein
MMQNLFKKTLLVAGLPVAMLLGAVPLLPATASNPFDVCVEKMVKGGVAVEKATTACAGALSPRELSQCVEKIRDKTDLPAEDVLQNCYRVRRPVDMASCVTDINSKILGPTTDNKQAMLSMALNSCRSSLQPRRYAECVIGMDKGTSDMSPDKLMDTCLNAEDFPRDLFPAYTE